MIAKKYNNKLYIFEKRTGMTGVFSNDELHSLICYVKNGKKNDFIKRLYRLGILTKTSNLDYITQAINADGISLQSLHVDITTDCPLKCRQCYKEDLVEESMTIKSFEKLIDEAKKLKIFQIAIGGGEPLVHPCINDFIKVVSKTEMAVTITSSGYNMTDDLLDKLICSGLNHIQISLNSVDERINNLSRDGYKYAFNAIEKLSERQLSFGINMVIRKDNLHTFFDTVHFAKKHGAENINLLRYKPSSFEDYNENCLNEEEFISLAEKVKRVRGINIKVDSAYSNLLIYINGGNISEERVGCGAGKSFIAITAGGKFKPCSHLTYEEKSDSIINYLKKANNIGNILKCSKCIYGDLCKGCKVIGFDNCPVYKEKKYV